MVKRTLAYPQESTIVLQKLKLISLADQPEKLPLKIRKSQNKKKIS